MAKVELEYDDKGTIRRADARAYLHQGQLFIGLSKGTEKWSTPLLANDTCRVHFDGKWWQGHDLRMMPLISVPYALPLAERILHRHAFGTEMVLVIPIQQEPAP